MVVVAVTGGNTGCGYEGALQLAAEKEIEKIILTTRSNEKGQETIAQLVKETGKDASFFSHIAMDLASPVSVKAAVQAFPENCDRFLLNAGGLGKNQMHESGHPDAMVINTLGHSMFVDEMMAAGKISRGNWVVYVGTELARDLWSLVPFQPTVMGKYTEADIDWALSTNFNRIGSCIPPRKQIGDYSNAKRVGQMHFTNLANENKEIVFLSTSPGACGGSAFARNARFPTKQLMLFSPCILRVLCVSHACMPGAALKEGCKRYVEVMTGDKPKFESGSMPMSGYPAPCKCCAWSGCGPMYDNRKIGPYFRDEKLCKAATDKVRAANEKWAESKGVKLTFGKVSAANQALNAAKGGLADAKEAAGNMLNSVVGNSTNAAPEQQKME